MIRKNQPTTAVFVVSIVLVAFLGRLNAETLKEKAAATIIPKLELNDASVSMSFGIISALSGIEIDCDIPAGDGPRINLSFENVPAKEAIKYVGKLGAVTVEYGTESVRVSKE